jgi:hypothetical protein
MTTEEFMVALKEMKKMAEEMDEKKKKFKRDPILKYNVQPIILGIHVAKRAFMRRKIADLIPIENLLTEWNMRGTRNNAQNFFQKLEQAIESLLTKAKYHPEFLGYFINRYKTILRKWVASIPD